MHVTAEYVQYVYVCQPSVAANCPGVCSGDVRMGGSSDDEGEAGGNNNNKNSDDFLKFAFAHRSDSSKGASNKAGTSNKASLRAQLSEALSGKKSVRSGDDELLSML